MLAEKIGERNIWKYRNLNASAHYIEKVATELGYEVKKQEYRESEISFSFRAKGARWCISVQR